MSTVTIDFLKSVHKAAAAAGATFVFSIIILTIASVSYTHLDVYKRQVCVCVCVCVSTCVDFFSMANDNSRKFKQNQIIFCIKP